MLGSQRAGAGPADESAQPSQRLYRIGIFEADANWENGKMLDAVRASLRAKGWDKKIEYPPDAFKSGAAGDGEQAARMAGELMDRKDLDCIFAMGTVATQALLARNNGRTPIVGMTLSDPVSSGVVKSTKDSGVDNLTTCVIPNRWRNMLRLFNAVVRFKKLGVIYHDTPAGRTFTNVEDARDVTREQGVALLEYKSLESEPDTRQCLKGIDWLIGQGMDAFYIPDEPCFDWSLNDPRPLFEHLNAHHIATFARIGLPLVQLGAMMGSWYTDLRPLGDFQAAQVIAILQGAVPRTLNMIKPDELGLAVNLGTAREVGRDFSEEALVSADVIVARAIDLQTVRQWYSH